MYVLSPVVYTMHKALFNCPDLVTVCKTTQSCPYIISALSGDSGTLFVVSLILDARSVAGVVVCVILAVGFLRCACYPAVCACVLVVCLLSYSMCLCNLGGRLLELVAAPRRERPMTATSGPGLALILSAFLLIS